MNDMPPPVNACSAHVEAAAAAIDRVNGLQRMGQGLCCRCQYGVVTRRRHDLNVRIWCNQVNQRMPPDIEECSKFQNTGQLTIWQLAQIAEIVDVRTKARIGFDEWKP